MSVSSTELAAFERRRASKYRDLCKVTDIAAAKTRRADLESHLKRGQVWSFKTQGFVEAGAVTIPIPEMVPGLSGDEVYHCTQEVMDRSHPTLPACCPVAVALRAVFNSVAVYIGYAWLDGHQCRLPETVTHRIVAMDNGERVNPFTFQLGEFGKVWETVS